MSTAVKESITIEGNEVTISNPEKLLFPEAKITKVDYLQKLALLSPYLLRYCKGRYLTTIRYPNGIHDKQFYQKNYPKPKPPYVNTATVEDIHYVNLDSLSTLMWLGNLACLEFHPSLNLIGSTYPAEWIIDLDPTLPYEPRMMEAAFAIGEILESLRIASVPKTSGATGIQIYIPLALEKHYTFEKLRKLGHLIASFAVQKHPKLFTIERLKKDRGDKIYIDYLQHWHGKTLSAPYTPRAREHATLSTPLLWKEVEQGCDPRDFNLHTIQARLQQKGDLIAQIPPQNLDAQLAQFH